MSCARTLFLSEHVATVATVGHTTDENTRIVYTPRAKASAEAET